MKKDAKKNVERYLNEGLIKKGDYSRLVNFYMDNAKKSLSTADSLKQISESMNLKKELSLLDDFESYLWVVVASYYSMFYAVNALFAANGIKIGDKIVHKISSDVFYHYFIANNKLAKSLFDAYTEAQEEVMDITQTQYPAQAEELARNFDYELDKRGRFQYNMLLSVKKSYAETSLKRAKDFVDKIEVVIKQMEPGKTKKRQQPSTYSFSADTNNNI